MRHYEIKYSFTDSNTNEKVCRIIRVDSNGKDKALSVANKQYISKYKNDPPLNTVDCTIEQLILD